MSFDSLRQWRSMVVDPFSFKFSIVISTNQKDYLCDFIALQNFYRIKMSKYLHIFQIYFAFAIKNEKFFRFSSQNYSFTQEKFLRRQSISTYVIMRTPPPVVCDRYGKKVYRIFLLFPLSRRNIAYVSDRKFSNYFKTNNKFAYISMVLCGESDVSQSYNFFPDHYYNQQRNCFQ